MKKLLEVFEIVVSRGSFNSRDIALIVLSIGTVVAIIILARIIHELTRKI